MRSIVRKSVAVVGGAGFLGSHLVNHLIKDRECHVTVIDNLVTGRRDFVHPDADFIHHDITTSEDHLARILLEQGVEYVFNYAAHPYIPDCFNRPLHVFETNANGAMKVINAAHAAGVEAILQVSSAELYGHPFGDNPQEDMDYRDRPWTIDESDEVHPHSTYGAAKAAVDYYCQCAWRERGTPVIALRQFNCVGERETHPYVVPEIISQLDDLRLAGACPRCFVMCNDTPCVQISPPCAHCGNTGVNPAYTARIQLGNNSTRDFLYAGDAVAIAVELLEMGQFGEVYNLGSETGVKIYDLAVMIGKIMGFRKVQVVEDELRKRPWEIWHLLSNNTKIYGVIGRRGISTLERALKLTIDWYNNTGRKWPWERGVN